MTAQTTAQRQAAYKARKRAQGLVQATQVWVHPQDVQRIREYAASLRWAREHYQRAIKGQEAYLESSQAQPH